MTADARVVGSIREVDSDTWLIGGQLLLHRTKGMSSTSTWYDQKDDFSYTIVDAPVPPPHSDPLRVDNPNIKLVYDAGDCSAVWSIGNDAFCKVKIRAADVTREVAGYLPKDWIRTKFRIGTGLTLPESAADPLEWRREVQKLLGEHGFEDRADEWDAWWN